MAKVQTVKVRIENQTDILYLKPDKFELIKSRAFAVISTFMSMYLDSEDKPEPNKSLCFEYPFWGLICFYLFNMIWEIREFSLTS